jgi:hypothetical protein
MIGEWGTTGNIAGGAVETQTLPNAVGAGKLVVVWIKAQPGWANTTAIASAVSLGGTALARIGGQVQWGDSVEAWRCYAPGGGFAAGAALNVTYAGTGAQTTHDRSVSVWSFANASATAPIRQSKGLPWSGTATTAQVTYDTTPLASSLLMGEFSIDTYGTRVLASGCTEDMQDTAIGARAFVVHATGPTATVGYSALGVATAAAGFAIEIAA